MIDMRSMGKIEAEIERQEALIVKRKQLIYKGEDRVRELRNLLSRAREREALKVGVDVVIASIDDVGGSLMVTTSENLKWWDTHRKARLGKHRVTQDFYKLLVKCRDEKIQS